MTTSIPAVKAALFTLFDGVTGIQPFRGSKPSGLSSDRLIGVGKVAGTLSDEDANNRPMPFGTLEEHYTVELTNEVSRPTSDMAAVETQLYADYEACKAAVFADPTLGGLVIEAMPYGDFESDDSVSGDSYAAWLVWHIDVIDRF